jgi:regulator of protease activity HflC (stomatin/prohibitin superfamily)
MADAAEVLDISKEAVRKRVQRGTLRSEVGEDGRRYVYLDAGRDDGQTNDSNRIVDSDPRDDLIATLKEQLEAERNAHAETRRIAYALAQRVPELEAPPAPRDAPQTAAEAAGGAAAAGGAEPPSTTEGAEEGTERRSWWRTWFGF